LETNIAKTDSLSEVEEALQALGYSQKEIRKILPKLDAGKSTSDLVRDALKLM